MNKRVEAYKRLAGFFQLFRSARPTFLSSLSAGAAAAFAASSLIALIAAGMATQSAVGAGFFDACVLGVAGCAIVAGWIAFGATNVWGPEHACSNLTIDVGCYLLFYSALLALVVRVSPKTFLSEPWNAVPGSPDPL